MNNGFIQRGKITTQTFNTCSFDSIFQAFCVLYADHDKIKNAINELSHECASSSLICSMFSTEGTLSERSKKIYINRFVILETIFSSLKFKNGLKSIDCVGNINYTIQKALCTNLYSYTRTKRCNNCNDEIVSKRCFVDINFKTFEEKGISKLNDCLNEELEKERL